MLVRHEVSVDGLAKGYVVDLALTAARRAAPKAAKLVIDIGGDLVVQGARPHAVAITDPRRPADNAPPLCVLAIKERAVATSGGYERSAKGAPGSHIVDPDTGKPVERVVSASVIASKCVDADAIATALNVMEPARGIAWVSALANVECLVVDARGGIHESPGFAGFCTQRTASSDVETAPAPPRSIASTDHVVTFVFELAKPEGSGRPYRRPYVAAWVAKPGEEKPVRALCLWIEQQRWMRDLKVWYRLYRKEKKLIRSLTRATRRSGRYSLTWDGRDEDGTSLPCGTYEIHLEVAREHGTHQHLKAEVRVEKHTIAVKLEPNVEVAGAVIHVHPRGKKPE